MKKVNCTRLAGLSFALVLAACADPVDKVIAPGGTSELRALDPRSPEAAERAALEKIGRLVAVSLGEKGMRHQLKKHLRAAPFKEHKLELSAYLQSADGTQLLTRLGAGEKKSDAILTLINQVRPLELYMPARKQRESWVGDAELLVAVQLEESDAIVAFDNRGKRLELNPGAPPEQPTIAIVPVETRFDKPMPLGSENINDMNGAAIGTLVRAGFKTTSIMCADCPSEDLDGGGGGAGTVGGGGSVAPGLYLEFSRILDRHESWVRGDPEIEVHIQGPTDQGNPRLGDDLSCSGESVYDSRKSFNQDDGFWTGRVMLFSAEETERFQNEFPDGFHVMFWEDDDTACILKLDNDVLIELLKATASTASVAIKVVPIQWRVVASVFIAAFFSNPGEWLRTNDDFVGVAVPVEQTGYYYPENTHVIMEGTTLNGRANIVYHP